MSSNTKIVTILSVLFLAAMGLRIACGPWQGTVRGASMYAEAKLGPQVRGVQVDVQLAAGKNLTLKMGY